jgi:hypothetical protein
MAALAGGVLLVLFLFPPSEYRFYPRCVFHALTGLQCPGCGGLRAAHQLLHGNWASAFHCNPLLVTMLPFSLLWMIAHLVNQSKGNDWWRPFRHPAWPWLLLTVAVAFGIARNLS